MFPAIEWRSLSAKSLDPRGWGRRCCHNSVLTGDGFSATFRVQHFPAVIPPARQTGLSGSLHRKDRVHARLDEPQGPNGSLPQGGPP